MLLLLLGLSWFGAVGFKNCPFKKASLPVIWERKAKLNIYWEWDLQKFLWILAGNGLRHRFKIQKDMPFGVAFAAQAKEYALE